ncbi:MAG: zraS 1 [Acidobacteria bacterium]|jgi:signal transduction histidine kinase|nr:zraS 1 [Acidobacteriota bacterium]
MALRSTLGSLTNRIFLASALLAVLSTASAILIVSRTLTADAERELQRGLDEAAALVTEWQATLSENFQLAARLVAEAPPLKAAVDTGDPATVAPLARDYRERIRSAVLVVTDRAGRVLAQAGSPLPAADLARLPVAEAARGREAVSYWRHRGGVLQLVTVPVAAPPQVIGTLSVGFLFDRGRAADVRRLTESEVAFVVDGQVCAATLPADSYAALAPLIGRPGTSRVRLGGEEFVALVRPLVSPGAAGAAARADAGERGAAAVVLQSRTERLRFLAPIRATLVVTALLAILGAVLSSYLVARTVTRPLGAITGRMREVAATGDLGRKITLPAGGWGDEDARLLATTFNALTDSLARFQREAGQRERLSSLGRMATVVAHEVRNPLMIIKAALHGLRRGDATPEQVAEAARDIAGEVERLNRVVNEVLDFARPIRFELAEVELGALCRDAAGAVAAADPDPPVSLAGPPGPLPLVTDGERVRAVLVNLLANARQAVRAAGPAAGTPGVELAHGIADGRAWVEVRDRGAGMSPEQLGRAFEPYFTTTPGGTGLGLAISRNVVEGLGGTIAVASTAGAGTTVRIELPPGAARGAAAGTGSARG